MGSDLVTTLFLNYKWRKIIAESLLFRYDYLINELGESDEDNASEQIQGLIDDLYTREPQLQTQYIQASRTSNQTIVANTPTALIWQAGDFDVANPTRLYFPITGNAIISVNFAFVGSGNTVPLVWLRFKGDAATDRAYERSDAAIVTHYFNESWNIPVLDNWYVEVFINSGVFGGTINHATIVPRIAVTVFGDDS